MHSLIQCTRIILMMLAKLGNRDILSSQDYIFEPKLDGYRAILSAKDKKIHIMSRGGHDITSDYPEFKFEIEDDCVLDGEIVVYDSKGNPSFSMMQRRSQAATYIAFDILQYKDKDLKKLSLQQRKKILDSLKVKGDRFQKIIFTSDGRALWDVMVQRNLEGVMAKKKDGRYTDGRSSDWIKIKNVLTLDCVIVGYISKVRKIASLALALYEGKELVYIGQVGTGFDARTLVDLEARLRRAHEHTVVRGIPRNVIVIVPDNVCEVRYIEFTRDMRLRAPVYVGLRADKTPLECTMDQLRDAAKGAEEHTKRAHNSSDDQIQRTGGRADA